MDIQRFFEHWNLAENPFQAEEARNDAVYRRVLEAAITHPDFAKIYGNPDNPSTTVVFGEKGSGKTAMRLMIEQRLRTHNRERQDGRTWLVNYDELNPMLDRLSTRVKGGDPVKVLDSITLSDHQDSILSRGVTDLLDSLLSPESKGDGKQRRKELRRMSREKRIDLATLALLYDQPRHGEMGERWHRLLSALKIQSFWNRRSHGLVVVLLGLVAVAGTAGWRFLEAPTWEWLAAAVAGGLGFLFFGIWFLFRAFRNGRIGRRVEREIRVVSRVKGEAARHLWDLKHSSIAWQPIPHKGDQDSRYELTSRFLQILGDIGYSSLIVLVDRIDEPMMINGDANRMRRFLWPMLNNKFLQQERIGLKMLLPIEMGQMIAGEDSEFKRMARLDKQNVVNPLKWTGATLYDLCTWRFRNCQKPEGEKIDQLSALFDDEVDSEVLIDALDQMHQPRDAFKFLYAVISEHCKNTPQDSENYRVPKATLDQVRREQSQRVLDLYRGTAAS